MNESQVFAEVLRRATPAERAAYLDAACAGAPSLRADVEALLMAHAHDPDFLERPAGSAAGLADAPPGAAPSEAAPAGPGGTERPGVVLGGRYKLLEMIGEGGMGSVWMAWQIEPVRRPVAVKLVKAGMDSRQVLARFEAERQALALMDHPNIARVLDAGAAPGGRPFFVMELVKGLPITRYCDEHRLTPRQRLELLVPVCQAVQHAHQKGVIHRDLKPSNVLVALYDDTPVPKVIDFGVAKATGQELTEQTLQTTYGAVVGTVEYMSPEQASFNQLDVDTRSDVYALGVLLYELLTGSPPFTRQELGQAGVLEMLRVIREREPARPSTKLSTANGLPALAASRGTEPAKLPRLVRGELDWIVMKALEKDRTRRYETANGLAADLQHYLNDEPVLACPPSAGYRLRKFARRNKQGLAFAGLTAFFVVLLGAAVGWSLRDRAAREQVREGERLARLAVAREKVNQALTDAAELYGLGKWPEALEAVKRADGFLAAGGDAGLAGRVEEMRADLRMVLRLDEIRFPQAVAGAEGAVDPQAEDLAYARAFRDYGIDVDALGAREAAARIRSRRIMVQLTAALDHWARRRRESGLPDDAGWERLIAAARAADPDDWRNRVRDALAARDLATLSRLAASERVKDLPLPTLSLLVEALDDKAGATILRLARQKYPDDFWINFQSAWTFEHAPTPDLDEAIRYYTAALALRPRNVPTQRRLASSLLNRGRFDEAVAAYRKANELDPPNAWAPVHLIMTLVNHGNFRRAQGRLDEAVGAYRKAIELDPGNADARFCLAHVLMSMRRFDAAAAEFREAVRLRPGDAGAWCDLGLALARGGRTEEALAAYGEALRLQPAYALAHNNMAWQLATCGDPQRRDPQRALALARKATELRPQDGNSWNTLGAACYRAGDWAGAAAALDKSMTLRHGGDALDWFFLAMARWRLGEKDQAREWYDRAARWMETNKSDDAELRRFREEAALLLGLNEPKKTK